MKDTTRTHLQVFDLFFFFFVLWDVWCLVSFSSLSLSRFSPFIVCLFCQSTVQMPPLTYPSLFSCIGSFARLAGDNVSWLALRPPLTGWNLLAKGSLACEILARRRLSAAAYVRYGVG